MKERTTHKARRGRAEELLRRLEQFGPDTLGNLEMLELLGAGPGAPTLFELAHS